MYFGIEYRLEERVPTPVGLSAIHVRWTPALDDEHDVNTLTLPLVQFDCAFYRDGVFFASGAGSTGVNTQFFSSLDLGSVMKVFHYTSVHYLTILEKSIHRILSHLQQQRACMGDRRSEWNVQQTR